MLETAPPETSAPPPRSRSARKRAIAILVAVALLGGGAAVAGFSYFRWCGGADGPQKPVKVLIPEGATADEVVSLLHERGVIRCGWISRYAARATGLTDGLRAGDHELTTNMRLEDALRVLAEAPKPAPTVDLTIPEGYRLTQIAERAAEIGVPPTRFLALAESGEYALPPYLPKNTPTVEGFLFPKTYEFLRAKVDADEVISRLLEQFEIEVESAPWENADRLGVSPYEVVVIASMIEREARVPEERPLIAAVIYNRLDRRMTLGIDATLEYVDPTPESGLTESDLSFDSPYNTRLYLGLPPTPIASPRLESILAALEPADVGYRYYVLCGADGTHEFTVGYDEFLQKRAECNE